MWGAEGEMPVLFGDTLGVRTMFDEVTWDVDVGLLIDIERAQVQGFVCLACFSPLCLIISRSLKGALTLSWKLTSTFPF